MSFATYQAVSPARVRTGLHFADVASATSQHLESGRDPREQQTDINRIVDLKAVMYQAQGLVMVDLNTSAPDALVRMRAHAFAHDIDLDQLARSILDGTTRLDQDRLT